MKRVIILLFSLVSISTYSQCFEITSVFVDACDNSPIDPEGANEMFTFEVGATALNVNDLTVFWPNNNFLNFCLSPVKTAALNATITNSCGFVLEPTANVLPANAKVIVVASTDFSTTLNSFNGLADTMYILYQCSGNTQGHFANAGSGTRTLIMNVSGACAGSDAVTYDRALLFGGNGATVVFDAAGNANYVNNGCNAPVVSYSPAWNISDVCQTTAPINLNTLLSAGATAGGTWTGLGVVDSIFNPTGIIGSTSITYSLPSITGCSTSLDSTNTFNVVSAPTNTIVNVQSCDSLFYLGVWFYNDTILNDTLAAVSPFACDSTYTSIINITSEIIDSSYFEACGSFTFDAVVYLNDTILYDTLLAGGGSTGGAVCNELYFSEYAEGTSNNKYIEIYNGTGVPVNLANYSIEVYNNGGTAASGTQVLSGLLANNDVYVVYNPNTSNATIQAAGDLASTITFYNGDDALALFNNGVMIDLIGNIGCDPGGNWSNAGLETNEQTLVRNANYTTGVTVDPANVPCDFPSLTLANWTGLPQDDFSNIGFHVASCGGSISSGCDTIVVTEINILESVSLDSVVSACDSVQVSGIWISSSITINDTIIGGSFSGCDSITNYIVSINTSSNTFATATSCLPADTGIAINNFTNINGCDSIHTITTTLLSTDTTLANATSCLPADTGIVSTTFMNANGCDSIHIVTTTLISCNFCFDFVVENICFGDSVFANNAWQTVSGVYLDTVVSPNIIDCDTLVETTLNVAAAPSITNINLCTNIPAQAGLVIDTFYNALSCDSMYQFTNTVYILPTIENVSFCTNVAANAGIVNDTIYSIGSCDSIYRVTSTTFIPVSYVNANDVCTNISATAGIDTTLSISSVNGCDSVFTITETIFEQSQTTNLVISICEGESEVIFGQNESAAGVYTNTISSILGCDSLIENIQLVVNPLPNVVANETQEIIVGTEVVLNASGANTYVWNTAETTSQISVSPLVTTEYSVEGEDVNGCLNSDMITITVIQKEVEIQMPTAFSPNRDGVNDTFRIVNESNFEDIDLKVYNRWGELIFKSTENITGWDGVYKNQLQPIELYVYYINAKEKNTGKIISLSGTISLIR